MAKKAVRKAGLGAAGDDPAALITRAIDEATRYVGKDSFKLRRAAETGWLAASSVADVAAKQMGTRAPRGFQARHDVLHDLETRAKLHRGTLTLPFQAAKGTLHGECFHQDVCAPPAIKSALHGVQDMAEIAHKALAKLRGRRG